MDIKQLEQIIAVVECKTLSAASEKLYISQPALTKSIKRLEEELGFELFERVGKKLLINENGRIVYDTACRILITLNQMKQTLNQNMTANKKIVNLCTNAPAIIRYYIPIFLEKYPDYIINADLISQEDVTINILNNHTYDVIIVGFPLSGEGISNYHVFSDDIIVHVPQNSHLAKKSYLLPEDLDGIHLMLPENALQQYSIARTLQLLDKQKINYHLKIMPDIGGMMYFLTNSDVYASLNSGATLHFWAPENKKAIILKDKAFRLHFYASFKEEKAMLLRPFLTWLTDTVGHTL